MVTLGLGRRKASPRWTSWLNVESLLLSSVPFDFNAAVEMRRVALGNVTFLINFITFPNGLKGQISIFLYFKGLSVLNQAPVVQEAELMTVFRGNADLQGSDQSSRH